MCTRGWPGKPKSFRNVTTCAQQFGAATPFSFENVALAFECFAKPETYVVGDLYEPERHDYEEMLGGLPRELLEVANLGTVAWGPLHALTPQATGYLLPRLMELACSQARDKSGDLFMTHFVMNVSEGPSCTRFSLLTPDHCAVVAEFLDHLAAQHGELIERECLGDVLAEGRLNWRSNSVQNG